MRETENIQTLMDLPIHYMGMIFFKKSPRNIEKPVAKELTNEVKRIGVFVNEEIHIVLEKAKQYNLDYIQLHGGESLSYCTVISESGLKIIKVFSVDKDFDFDQTKEFNEIAEYFLFDTKGETHGGTGKSFDWSVLQNYKGDKPFFLGGGIGPESIQAIKELNHPKLFALDLNSKFEINPGLKNIELLENFISELTLIKNK